jgi:hypothetical protein
MALLLNETSTCEREKEREREKAKKIEVTRHGADCDLIWMLMA